MNFPLLRCLPFLAVLLTLGLPSLTQAATLTIPSAAYPTIQSGINAAQSGDTVLVADGTYTGLGNVDLDFGGRNITVKSVNGPTSTIIDCQGSAANPHRGFYFHNGETAAAKLDGFAVKNGFAHEGNNRTDNGYGGGMFISFASPTITHCTFSNNTVAGEEAFGGGMCVDSGNPTITACTFSGNTAGIGGFQGAVYVYGWGGGLAVMNGAPTITACTFSGNMAKGDAGYGGGIIFDVLFSASQSHVVNCVVTGNSAVRGGGIFTYYASPTLTNCTCSGNTAAEEGGGIAGTPTLTNCVIYGDYIGGTVQEFGPNEGAPSATYSDIQGGYAGTGNINADPLFVNVAAGDLHLKPGSPCLDAGTPNGAPPTDLDGRTRPSRPSIGAYELGATLNVPSQYPTIQAGIDAARPSDTVLVADGTYTGDGNRDIDFHGKNLTVKSVNGPAKTVIDCGGYASTDGSGNHRGFYIHSREQNVTIRGFTVKNGYRTSIPSIPDSGLGGGVYNNNVGGTITLTDCTITASTAQYHGGGVYNVNGSGTTTLTNCTLAANTAQEGYGAGINNVNGSGTITLTKCTVAANIGQYYSGIYNGNSGGGAITLTDCTITANTARSGSGGGVYNLNLNGSTTTLTDCTITANTARSGGGVYNDNSEGHGSTITLTNCTLAANTAQDGGGGVYNVNRNSTVTLTNCTIIANIAHYYGGGVYNNGTITLTNDIIYGDTGGEVYNYFSTPAISYSDIQGGYAGTGNIDADPLFINAAAGDLHLKPGSPCLGAGTPNGAPPTDLDGTPRPNPPSMGAYELAPAPAAITAFTLSPSQVAAIGPNITVAAAVTASGTFSKVTVSPAPGMLGSASPTFTLTNSGAAWTGVIPTAYLKLARANPITFIATGTRADGTTATATTTLIVGALPALSLAVSPPARNVARLQRVNFTVTVSNPSLTVASLATVTVSLPDHVTLVSAPNFQYDGVKTLTYQGTLGTVSNFGSNLKVLPFTVEIVSGTPSNTQLPFPVKATCSNFQEADSIPILTVDGDVAPLGVAVNTSGGFGILDGDAQVDLAQGNTPLHATLTPKTSLNNLFQLFGSTHGASIYFEVFVSKTGQADFKPGGDPTSAFLAQNGLMSPSVSPSYDATFTTINDSISISTSFTPRAAVLTLADVFLTALALKTKKPVPSIDFLFKVSQNLAQLSAFGSAANEFTASRPKNTVQVLQAVARATKDLVSISSPEKQLLFTILKQYNLVDDNFTIDGVQKALKFAFTVNTLLHVAADSFTITIQTGGQPMVVQFDATSSKK